jgi:hypothetical protein
MFSCPTVFIIGAGASAEFGFPTGAALKQMVSEGLRFEYDEIGVIRGDREIFHRIQSMAGDVELARRRKSMAADDRTRLTELTEDARQFSSTIGSFASIDEALHFWSGDPEIVHFGKLAIANIMLKTELQSKLFSNRRRGVGRAAELEVYADSWLAHVFSIALGSLKREEATRLAFQKVTFINFNYDRTVERYLALAFWARARVSPEQGDEPIEATLNMIRPYGSVGSLDTVRYGARDKDLVEVAKNIRTFAEQQLDTAEENKIAQALEEAELVIFLGFGFHQQNLAILRPKDGRPRDNVRHVLGTVFGIDENNHDALKEELLSLGFRNSRPAILLDRPASKLITDLRMKIAMIAG